jgi:progesterone-induced-blocking factor 1
LKDGARNNLEAVRILKEKVQDLKAQREELYARIEKLRNEYRQQHDSKLADELQRLQEKSATEIEQIRVHQRQAFERELRALRESRDLSMAERDRLGLKLDELGKSYDVLKAEHQRVSCTMGSQIQQLRSALKIKEFEMDRTALAYEDALVSQRRANNDCQMLEKANEVLKREYYEMKVRAERVEAEGGAEICSLKERLQTYEALESELDLAIARGGSEMENRCVDEMVSKVAAEVPSTRQRRIRQSLVLAQRLLEKQKALDKLQRALEQEREEKRRIEEECSEQRRHLAELEQPHSFLIDSIRARDTELKRCREVITNLSEELRFLTKQGLMWLILKCSFSSDNLARSTSKLFG